MIPLQLFVAAVFGWLEQQQRDVIEFLREENRVLKRQLRGRRLQLGDDERRRLAVLGTRLGRRVLAEVTSLVTPDTILRWHRELIARKWTYGSPRHGRRGVQVEIRRLVVRMAVENPSWGYTRIQGALKNLGHCVARATVARILKEQGIPPSRERPMQWRTLLRAHWSALLAADFAVQQFLKTAGVRIVQTPFRAPNCNALAERFVRAIKEECLDRVIPLGERHLRRTLAEFAAPTITLNAIIRVSARS